jgi:hypothetical protein
MRGSFSSSRTLFLLLPEHGVDKYKSNRLVFSRISFMIRAALFGLIGTIPSGLADSNRTFSTYSFSNDIGR